MKTKKLNKITKKYILIITLFACFVLVVLPFIKYYISSYYINGEWASLKENSQYQESLNIEGISIVSQKVTCGYAVIEMFASYIGDNSITEDTLDQDNKRITTALDDGFKKEMNKRFTNYKTEVYRNLTNTEYLIKIYDSLKRNMPVPICWAAELNGSWTMHYSLVTGLSIVNDEVIVANPYGYYENLSIDNFLSRTRYDAYENMEFGFYMGFIYGFFDKNTLFIVS